MTTKKILVVDDEQDILDIIEDALSPLNQQIIKCQNGADALEVIKSEKIDLVITDMKMPVMGGAELLLKIQEYHMLLPVIVITAFGNKETMKQAWMNGAYDFLDKPLVLEDLYRATESALKYSWDSLYYKRKSERPEQQEKLVVNINSALSKELDKICNKEKIKASELTEFLLLQYILKKNAA